MSVAVSCGWVVGGGSLDLITYKLGVDSDVVAGTNMLQWQIPSPTLQMSLVWSHKSSGFMGGVWLGGGVVCG